MDSEREWREQQAPEAVNQDYPEAIPSQNYPYNNIHHNFQQQYPQQTHQHYVLPKPEEITGTYTTTPYSAYSGSHTDHTSPRGPFAAPATPSGVTGRPSNDAGKKGLRICGLNTLVVTLSAIIAALFVVVVGLAAGTGVEANRANLAEAKVRSMSSALSSATVVAAAKTITATASAATSTSFSALDRGCSGDAAAVSGTTYSAFACEFSFWLAHIFVIFSRQLL